MLSALVVLAAAVTFGVTWFVLDKSVKENQEVSDAHRASLQERIVQLEKKVLAAEDARESKTYTGDGYAVNYPTAWVYRVYNDSSVSLVAFADAQANLPAANSDQLPVISTSVTGNAAKASDLTSETKYVSKTTATIGSHAQATVWTLAAGRPNDLNGNAKIVIYEVKMANGKYLRLENVNDKNKDIYQKMLNSLKLS